MLEAPRRFRFLAWPLGTLLAFLALQIVLAPTVAMWSDSARYAQLAYQYLGADATTARQEATQLWCVDKARHAGQWNATQLVPSPDYGPDLIVEACRADYADHLEPTGSPRYQAIFSSRPGYPLAVAALAPLTGMRFALWLIPVASVLLAGLCVWRLLTLIHVRSPVAAGGQALLYVLPTSSWGVLPLTEGPVLLGVAIAMLGAVMIAVARRASGSTLLIVGLAVTGAVKYSTTPPLAAALTVAAVVAWWLRASSPRNAVLTAAIGASATGVSMVVPRLIGLPGLNETLQDSFTDHFAQPDVPNPLTLLWDANIRYWTHWIMLTPSNVGLVFGTAIGGWALWRWHRATALIVFGSAVTGVALTMAHPEPYQLDRLYVLVWLVTVVGLPVVMEHVARTTVRNPLAPEPVPSPGSPDTRPSRRLNMRFSNRLDA